MAESHISVPSTSQEIYSNFWSNPLLQSGQNYSLRSRLFIGFFEILWFISETAKYYTLIY